MYANTLLTCALPWLMPAYRELVMVPKYGPGSTFWHINGKTSIGEIKR